MNFDKSTQMEMMRLVESFTGQSNVLVIQRVLLEFMDNDHVAALLLSQILYWDGKQGRPDGGIAKTYDEWFSELGITRYQINRSLRLMPYVTTKVHRFNGLPVVHYYFDKDIFFRTFCKFLTERNVSFLQNDMQETYRTLTETTTEITTKHIIAPEKKNTYGEFTNVHLKQSEYDKLVDEYGESAVKEIIERLSAYIQSKNPGYKDHYATLRNWFRMKAEREQNGTYKTGSRKLVDRDRYTRPDDIG